jgi:DoxX-like family
MCRIHGPEKTDKKTEKNMSYLNSMTTTQQETAFVADKTTSNTMNIALWIAQVLWGVFFCFTGFGKILCYRADVWNLTLHQPVAWFSAVPQGLFVFIGICEFLGGVGLILPAMIGVKPKLTPFAAIGLTLVMILAAAFHIVRGELSFFMPMNLVIGGGVAFIAYGRLVTKPIASSSISTLRVFAGLGVLVALVLVGYAPISYQLTHTH